MALVAQVVVENATLHFDKPYSYLVPPEMPVQPGCRVTVPFGQGNRTRFGMVMALEQQPQPSDRLKRLATLVDVQPLLKDELLKLVEYLHESTFCGYYDAVRTLLPPGIGVALKYTYELARDAALPPDAEGDERCIFDYLQGRGKPVREQTMLAALGLAADAPVLRELCEQGLVIKSQEIRQRILDEKLVMVRLTDELQQPEDLPKLTPKQKAVCELLMQVGQASLKEVCYFAAAGKTVVDRLEQQGLVHYFTREVYRNPYANCHAQQDAAEIVLSLEQQTACEALCGWADSGQPQAALLYGVTGSGKTEVFLRVIRHVLESGRGVIVMVPEISLTPQTLARFHRYFGDQVAVMHSGLSMSERMDEWKRIRNGDAQIVVGTRSAVFAPLARIGMIVMDEEQESSYKSEMSPRYHAREVARMRCASHQALLLLASATPSIESFHRAKQGRYHLLELRQRFGTAKLPDVTVLDLSLQPLEAGSQSISPLLLEELKANLAHGEQSILLLNRRGYHTLVKCAMCNTVAQCPHCSVALTYHSANGHLMCHYCGYTAPANAQCPVCNSKFRRFSGAGTQKVEEELSDLLPGARVLRMDLDTTMARFSHEKHFSDFSAGKYDIIIGTQMVAKGLDFPNVTLVGILSADSALYAQDYRSFERAFALFTQVVGRSGRSEKAGRAYLQTFTPENPIIAMAAAQDYDRFYQEEIESRRIHLYPPYCDMVGVGFSGLDSGQVQSAAQRFLQEAVRLAKTEYPDLPLRLLGPCESVIAKLAGRYRWRMAIKCRYDGHTREWLWKAVRWYYAQNENKLVSLSVDPKFESAI